MESKVGSQVELAPQELAAFLSFFCAVYLGLRDILPHALHDIATLPDDAMLDRAKASLAGLAPKHLGRIFGESVSEPRIARIQQNSPIEIVFIGSAFLMIAAAVLSGGKVQITLTGIKATLPPLGEGIKALREALSLSSNLSVGFGLREVTIKLNTFEFNELMKPVRGVGGFESFLRSLQTKVNKQTRQIVLSPGDIDKIYRHKADPKKGGWQARIKRIFERHLPGDRTK
jgi:hypothetical protein